MEIAIAIGVVGLVIILLGQWATARNQQIDRDYYAKQDANREAERARLDAEWRSNPFSDYGIQYKDVAVLLGSGEDRRVVGDGTRYLEWAALRDDLDSNPTSGLDAWWKSLGGRAMQLSLVYEQRTSSLITGTPYTSWSGPYIGVAVDEQSVDWQVGDNPRLRAEMEWALGLLRGLARTRSRELSDKREADRRAGEARQKATLDSL